MTRQKDEFIPLEQDKVKMYVCGVTPYSFAHIGNARPAIVFDTLFRFLRAQGNEVTYARNFTDVDDKIINAAKEQFDGDGQQKNCAAISKKFMDIYHQDMKSLNVLSEADTEGETSQIIEPLVTTHMAEIVEMIVQLLDNGYAYIGESGDVLYDTAQFPDYGKLSGKNLDELIAGARVEISADKKNPTDFVLWKSAKEGEPTWDFDVKYPDVNAGRPGWHIECSAMSNKHLGETFDIHGGGEDLQFPHHDCEIAQSKGAHGGGFAQYWMHNAFINVDGEKMAKSVGNFKTVHGLLETYSGEALRLWMLSTHYRKPVDLTESALDATEKSLKKMQNTLRRADELGVEDIAPVMPIDFIEAMENDLNTSEALAALNESFTLLNKAIAAESIERAASFKAQIMGMAGVLGLFQQEAVAQEADAEIDALVAKRDEAKASKDWAMADEIRDQLKAKGITLEDSKNGTTWRKE